MPRRLVAGAIALGLSLALAPAASQSAAAGPRDPLTNDTDGAVRELHSGGVQTFVGARPGTRIDNPDVTPSMSARAAARAHLERYGAAFGTDRAGTELVETGRTRAVSGKDVVRFRQEVDGLPVVAAESVVTLGPDRELTSIDADLSSATEAPPAVVTEAAAETTALGRVARTPGGHATATSAGRWLFDPAVVGMDDSAGAKSVWRFEVRAGAGTRRLVLVDDQTGAVALDLDMINHADRVVCDNLGAPIVGMEQPCDSGFARVEGGAASAVADVNLAYDLAGVTSDYYQQIGGFDLTEVVGHDAAGTGDKKLASTVRVCFAAEGCPMANAFWNGIGMYYGAGYAGADDVVAHEITHGLIERSSNLFYWGQSGAINESLADIMGEIVDHRHVAGADVPGNWELGEDLPGGAVRNVADPTLFDAPDRMASPHWWTDPNYVDNAGVHVNSGVGNKTFHLASQGGMFNGQTITGIDAGDASLTQSATLWLEVIARLSSGSDYADLGVVLDQACTDLIGFVGFTAADCTQVHNAGVATELAKTPPNDPHPADAPATCPSGAKQVLFRSEGGSRAEQVAKFTAGPTWVRSTGTDGSGAPSNAHSGQDSWATYDPDTQMTSTLAFAKAVTLPAGQRAYLWFQHWYDLEFGPNPNTNVLEYYDGGTVEVDDRGDANGPVAVSGLPWVNGPSRALQTPNAGTLAWSGDSRGYVASRVDLSGYAGRAIAPQFTMRSDQVVGYTGWFVDDIEIYTCKPPAPAVVKAGHVALKGKTKVGKKLTAATSGWPAGVTLSYRWLRNGKPIAKAAKKTLKLSRKDVRKRIQVQVTGSRAGHKPAVVVSSKSKRVRR